MFIYQTSDVEMKFILLPIFLIFKFISISTSAKVLIFVHAVSNSDQLFTYRVGDLLAANGHNVTLYRPQYDPDLIKLIPPIAKELHFKAVENETVFRDLHNQIIQAIYSDGIFSTINNIGNFIRLNNLKLKACETQIKDQNLMTKLREAKFDIAIATATDYCPIGMIDILQIPTRIWMTGDKFRDHMAWAFGVPSTASYVPSSWSPYGDRMNFFQRFDNFFLHLFGHAFHWIFAVNPIQKIFHKHYGKHFPDIVSLAAKSPVVFVNNHELLDFARPVTHNVVYMGGVGIWKVYPLKESWQKVMNNSIDGVVLVSFGIVDSPKLMPQSWKNALVSMFAKFPTYTFIWKSDDKFPDGSNLNNLVLSSFLPQNDLLAHPKTKAFITDTDFNNIVESAYQGVPMVVIPLGHFQDNIIKVEKHRIGIGISSKKDIHTEHLSNALEEILKNDSYKKNAVRLSQMMKNKPFKSDDKVLGWVKFLADFKEIPNFKSASTELSLIQYFLIDVYGFIFLIFILSLYIYYRLFYCCCCWCRRVIKEKRKTE